MLRLANLSEVLGVLAEHARVLALLCYVGIKPYMHMKVHLRRTLVLNVVIQSDVLLTGHEINANICSSAVSLSPTHHLVLSPPHLEAVLSPDRPDFVRCALC